MYLQMMKTALNNNEYKVVDYLMGEICEYKLSNELQVQIEQLKNATNGLMSEEAIDIIQIIQKMLAL